MSQNALRSSKFIVPRLLGIRAMSGPAGDGKAGAIREAGGAFGKLEAAREEEYFLKRQQEQLKKLRADHITQADYHQKQIQEHEEALKRHKEALTKITK
ncbi:ATPase inhibitor mai-2, mitochondrial-like [Sitodiplosis mosellana]|uniref:ATPase inhibitor mai-2, mitochondrial-like n=1 Tax=Sitodiplosis mosellana TaxID=263140 RepID=UPI0024441A27|nr:ATPase inhibitor mai-2, mitochondrial-like [Sitodiplosis mosellana]